MTTPNPTTSSGLMARAQQTAPTAAARTREGGEGYLFSIRDEVAELLTGSPFEVDSYLQAAYRTVLGSSQLVTATKQAGATVLGAIMLGATLQLPIGGPLGQFYLTPRGEGRDANRRTVCVPMIGYRGFFELGYRSGRIRSYDYLIRREKDTWRMGANSERGKYFDWEEYAGGEYDENDEHGEKRRLTGVVAIANTLDSGTPTWQFMSEAAIARRKPRTVKNTPWEGPNSDAMHVKTVHRELAKYLQLTIATAKAVEADETISQWNRHTGALETLAPDAAPQYAPGDEHPDDDEQVDVTGEVMDDAPPPMPPRRRAEDYSDDEGYDPTLDPEYRP